MARNLEEIKKEFIELLEEYDCDNLTLPVGAFDVRDEDGRLIAYLGLAEDGHIALLSDDPEYAEHWEEYITSDEDYLKCLNEILDLF